METQGLQAHMVDMVWHMLCLSGTRMRYRWHEPAGPLYSLSGRTSYRKISWSLEARFDFRLFQSLWNLTGISAAALPKCLSNFRAMRSSQYSISRLRDFTRFGGKTSYRLVNHVNRGPGYCLHVLTVWVLLISANLIVTWRGQHDGRRCGGAQQEPALRQTMIMSRSVWPITSHTMNISEVVKDWW